MFASAVGRLIWKEYRVQRALWFLLLGLLLVLQVLLRLAFFSADGSRSFNVTSADEQWATRAMWLLAFVMQVIFFVASIAISFAGEREERTCDLLIHHAPSPWAVLLAKIGICLAGSIALYFCGAFVAMAIGRSSPNDSYMLHQFSNSTPSIGTELIARVTLGLVLLAWCLFGSLLCQRVLTSIPTMAVGWVVTGWIPLIGVAAFLSIVTVDAGVEADKLRLMSAICVVAVAMIGVDIWLGYRWAEGKYIDLNFLSDQEGFWSIGWSGLFDRESRTSRMPLGIELDETERRTWQRLVWQERQRNVIPRWLTTCICAAIVIMSPIADVTHSNYGTPSAHDVAVCVLALAMGILSFRYDGEGQPVRFLANHGTSARMIWKAKQAVWMSRTFLTLVVLLALVAIRDSSWSTYPAALIERHLWLMLLSYGCGQLSAMLLRGAILAAITGAVATAVLFLWLELTRSLQLPQWWSLGIPAITPLLATYLHIRGWLLDGSTSSQKVRLAAVLIGLPCFTGAILAAYRIVEVDRTDQSWRKELVFQSPFDWRYEIGNLKTVQPTANLKARPRLQIIAETPADRRAAAEASSANARLSPHEQALADEVAGIFANNSALIHQGAVLPLEPTDAELGSIQDQAPRLAQDKLFPLRSFERLSDLLLARALDHLHANEQEVAFDVCLSHLSLCRAMARGPFMPCWKAGADRERRALEQLVEWANHPQVTFATIHGAIKEIERSAQQFPTPGSAIIDELAKAKRDSIIDEYTDLHGLTPGWLRIWLQLPWETRRRSQLWELEASLHRAYLNYLASRFSWGPDFVSRMHYGLKAGADENVVPVGQDYLQPMAGLQATTWGAEVALGQDRSDVVRDRFTAVNAALTRLGIIAYRKQHGKMPADLDALFGIVHQWNFQDPWSSGRLDYRVNCLVSQGNTLSGVDINPERTDTVIPRPAVASRFVFPIPSPIARNELSTPTNSKKD